MDNLKPCPFCGSTAVYEAQSCVDRVSAQDAIASGLGYSAGSITHTSHRVSCTNIWHCSASQFGFSEENVVFRWNNRTDPFAQEHTV